MSRLIPFNPFKRKSNAPSQPSAPAGQQTAAPTPAPAATSLFRCRMCKDPFPDPASKARHENACRMRLYYQLDRY
ncbi:hypothetical protein IWW45_002670 [Coemansia sp. RSA 485]|nr:hypothetical protein IWW45_002670 [Coemansia sp. RSA 485]